MDFNPKKSKPEEPFLRRQQQLGLNLQKANLPALALNPGPSLTYLTGLHFHLSERPVVAFFTPQQPPVLVLPELESAKIAELAYPVQSYTYSEDPTLWVETFRKAMKALDLKDALIGVEPRQMRFLELNLMQEANPQARFVDAGDVITTLRLIKDASEAQAMRKAVHIAQRALRAVLPVIQPGITERELAAELTVQLLKHGSDPQFPFAPIVSAGPNSANPHASPSDRQLTEGDLLVVDWGASFQGYISDLTRTFAIGSAAPEFQAIAEIVKQANEAARQICAPGIAAEAIDQAARQVIEKAGYGAYFIHRTGHGIGIEGHEEPYIRSGNPLLVQPGMTFTIEPGIYLPQRGGVRIEDNVMITPSGVECFSDLPRELQILPA